MGSVTLSQAIGAMVKAIRGDQTQQDLARAANIPQSTISAIERGGRTFRGVHLEAILAATNTSGVEAARMIRALAEQMEKAVPPPRMATATTASLDPRNRVGSPERLAEAERLAQEDARAALVARPKRAGTHTPGKP